MGDDVQRQINQMVAFIKQEAEEKAQEISVTAEEEFNILKLQDVEAERQRIRKEYERKEGQVETKKKIEHSTQLLAGRLKVLAARDEALKGIVAEASRRLATVAASPNYKPLLADLISQGITKLGEKAVVVRCRAADVAAVKEAVEAAKRAHAGVTITLDSASLPADSLGGVLVLSADGKVKVCNTLEERLHVCYEAMTPQLRTKIFGASGGQLRQPVPPTAHHH